MATDMSDALLERARRERERRRSGGARTEPKSGFWSGAEQFGAGTQTGIANALGFPVDALAGGISGIGNLTGLWGPIENPIGGSASIDRLISPLRANVPEPQTRGQRMARRVGEEVGAASAMAPLGFASRAVRAAPVAFAGTEAASALGSGIGAATANEMFPDSVGAEVIGALAGGIPAGYIASRAFGRLGSAPEIRSGIDEQRAIASDAYSQVRADERILPQESVQSLADEISNTMAAERMNPTLHPGAANVSAHIAESAGLPNRIEDIENLRRITESTIPVTAAPADRRLGGMMKETITDYLSDLNDPVADALVEGRNAHRRASAAQSVQDASTRAARRAASTGSGGNEINAMRQNLRSILDNPRKARSFSSEELRLMDQIVRGTGGQNAMRRLSRFAPTSGGLSAMLGIGGVMANPAVALPVVGLTEAAKYAGERSSRRVVDALMQSIAPDRVLSAGESGIGPVIQALLAGRTIAGAK